MSVFWKYFHDTLRWRVIFHPGPLAALVRGLALVMDDARQDILWLRRQYVPPRCDAEFMARFGASRGIVRWRFDSDDSYGRRVVNAFAWHKLGGKVRGLERILAENAFQARVLPSPDPELWAHFRLDFTIGDSGFDQDAAALAFWLANEYKAARSVLEGLWTRVSENLPLSVGVGLRSRTLGKLQLHFFPASAPALPRRIGLCVGGILSSRPRLWSVPRPSPRLSRRVALGIAAITATRVAVCRAA